MFFQCSCKCLFFERGCVRGERGWQNVSAQRLGKDGFLIEPPARRARDAMYGAGVQNFRLPLRSTNMSYSPCREREEPQTQCLLQDLCAGVGRPQSGVCAHCAADMATMLFAAHDDAARSGHERCRTVRVEFQKGGSSLGSTVRDLHGFAGCTGMQ